MAGRVGRTNSVDLFTVGGLPERICSGDSERTGNGGILRGEREGESGLEEGGVVGKGFDIFTLP